ncbi:hypothetical protein CsSME_00034401 [Camellia sinensis var. sinensis]
MFSVTRELSHSLASHEDIYPKRGTSLCLMMLLHFAQKLQWITSTSLRPYPKRRLGNSFARKPSNWTLGVIVPLNWRKYHKQLLVSVKVCLLHLQL